MSADKPAKITVHRTTMNIHLGDFKGWRRPDAGPGFCMDIGAPSSVIGIKELRRICSRYDKRLKKLKRSKRRFRFGDVVCHSLGTISLPSATPSGTPEKYVNMDVVSADVPALVGLDFLDEHSLMGDTVRNCLTKGVVLCNGDGSDYAMDEWHMPLTRKHHHVYAEMADPTLIFFTKYEPRKIHRQFCDASPDSFYKLLKIANPNSVTPETLVNLQELVKRCDPCQRFTNAPTRFRVSLGSERSRFNEVLFIDIVYIGSNPLPHIVDSGTHFSAARFLPYMTTKTVWAFISIAKASNVDVDPNGIEAHSGLGIGERYDQPIRNTFRKLKMNYPNVQDSILLAMTVKAMNDTLVPEGCVSSTIVFGEYPAPILSGTQRARKGTVEERSKIAETARKEMEQHTARLRLELH